MRFTEDFTVNGRTYAAADIPTETAAHVLAHFGRGGYEAGSFGRDLLSLIDRADADNFWKLAAGFPETALAVELVQNHPGGTALLQRIARGERPQGFRR